MFMLATADPVFERRQYVQGAAFYGRRTHRQRERHRVRQRTSSAFLYFSYQLYRLRLGN